MCAALLEAAEPQLLQPADLGLREALAGELRERRATPQRQRLVELALGLERLEAVEVELAGLDAQQVAGRPRLDPLAAEELAQVGDVDLQRLVDGRRRVLLPQRVDQPVSRDDAIGVEQQQGQQRALLEAAHLERPPIRVHLKRAEDADSIADLRRR